jgi:hypothetical protein
MRVWDDRQALAFYKFYQYAVSNPVFRSRVTIGGAKGVARSEIPLLSPIALRISPTRLQFDIVPVEMWVAGIEAVLCAL